jgi:hypothetical protein
MLASDGGRGCLARQSLKRQFGKLHYQPNEDFVMKSLLAASALLALAGAASMAVADDSPSDAPIKSPKQKMHECVTQRRSADAGLSVKDARKACAAELKTQENHPSMPAAPNNVPQN